MDHFLLAPLRGAIHFALGLIVALAQRVKLGRELGESPHFVDYCPAHLPGQLSSTCVSCVASLAGLSPRGEKQCGFGHRPSSWTFALHIDLHDCTTFELLMLHFWPDSHREA